LRAFPDAEEDIRVFFKDKAKPYYFSVYQSSFLPGWRIKVEGKQIKGDAKICCVTGTFQNGRMAVKNILRTDPAEERESLNQAESLLHRKIEFERMINWVSTCFLNASDENWDEIFRNALSMLGYSQNADRANFFVVHENIKLLECVFEWTKTSLPVNKKIYQSLNYAGEERFIEELCSKRVRIIANLEKLSDEFVFEKFVARKFGVKAFIAVPIFAENKLLGLYALSCEKENPEWEDGRRDEYILRQFSDVFGAALVNRSTKSKLFRNERLLSSTELLAKSGSWRFNNPDRHIYFSKGINSIFELDEDLEVLSIREFLNLIPVKDKEKVKSKVQKAINKLKTVSGEFIFTNKRGAEKHIAYSLQVNQLSPKNNLEVFGYCTDISEKKTVEKRLLLESQILAQVNEPIYVTDLGLQVIYMNEAAITAGNAELTLKRIGDLFKIVDGKSFDILTQRAVKDGISMEVLSILDRSGNIEPYEVSVKPIQNTDGEKIGYSFVIRNLKIFRRPKGYFVAMPQVKQGGGKHRGVLPPCG
jgi:PAS domain S-box-containing protein